jgi:hypothetical protein
MRFGLPLVDWYAGGGANKKKLLGEIESKKG